VKADAGPSFTRATDVNATDKPTAATADKLKHMEKIVNDFYDKMPESCTTVAKKGLELYSTIECIIDVGEIATNMISEMMTNSTQMKNLLQKGADVFLKQLDSENDDSSESTEIKPATLLSIKGVDKVLDPVVKAAKEAKEILASLPRLLVGDFTELVKAMKQLAGLAKAVGGRFLKSSRKVMKKLFGGVGDGAKKIQAAVETLELDGIAEQMTQRLIEVLDADSTSGGTTEPIDIIDSMFPKQKRDKFVADFLAALDIEHPAATTTGPSFVEENFPYRLLAGEEPWESEKVEPGDFENNFLYSCKGGDNDGKTFALYDWHTLTK
jgi:hypothetical protein